MSIKLVGFFNWDKTMKEYENNSEKFDCFNFNNYDNSHMERFNYLINDLELHKIKNSKIVDFGCASGFLIKKLLNKDNNNKFYGLDYHNYEHKDFDYLKVDFDYTFSDVFEQKYNTKIDIGFCFEVCEHIANLYNFVSEMKKIIKLDGILYLSIPHEIVTHNTLYPGLFYPVQNFKEFLEQMAFVIVDYRIHNKSHTQNVFTLINKDWSFSKMKWFKPEEKFRNISPLISVSL